jgi:hypothetical protein
MTTTETTNNTLEISRLEAEVVLLAVAQNNGWFYPLTKCETCGESHTDHTRRLCKWCKANFKQHDPDCNLGKALSVITSLLDRIALAGSNTVFDIHMIDIPWFIAFVLTVFCAGVLCGLDIYYTEGRHWKFGTAVICEMCFDMREHFTNDEDQIKNRLESRDRRTAARVAAYIAG